MANVLMLGPDLGQATYFSPSYSSDVGLWLPDRPLSNLSTDRRAHEAWSLDLTTDSTQLLLDLGTQRSIKGAALPWHNFSAAATVSLYVYEDAALTELKGSIVDSLVYREVYPLDSVLWEDAELWDGKLTAENRAIFPVPWFEIFGTPVIGRYVLVQINDTGNAEGRLKLSRLIVAAGYQPTLNAWYGSNISAEDASIRVTSLGGADYYDEREKRRRITFEFGLTPEDEAMANMLDQIYTLGNSQQVFVAWDPDDTTHRHRRSFPATIDRIDPLVAATYGYFRTTYQFREVVA
ncbi:hypothetical protein [Thalassobaculum litoreum]|uniref:Uncharacterized protein n=1 Tax=Thalassobaculum litoreum DSM 18839 TaxID=1123362 RepID=A0A8G2BI26_9PROT|nr:hypothetical protein [Thalassobaculum litoreum]SDF83801.1 hypothetical protein SAMN05660686_02483 [Thalassobaculum litoreum DSM 18839]